MPFYEYQCKQCGHHLEAMQKVNDAPLKKCPACGKSTLTRLMSAPVFRLKGGGWYETDFKSDQESKRNLAERPEGEAKKGESEPAASKATEASDGAKKPADKPADAKGSAVSARPAAAKSRAPVKASPRRAAAKRPVKKTAGKKSAKRR
ncbi:MAG: zinc ribbon domain-containing protein [Gammaproteobacteria bacterium]|nr:zinc ribbon domain-containing protein [Gammaproteobacteria bacterium]